MARTRGGAWRAPEVPAVPWSRKGYESGQHRRVAVAVVAVVIVVVAVVVVVVVDVVHVIGVLEVFVVVVVVLVVLVDVAVLVPFYFWLGPFP